jgi:hypothetical protein
MAESYRYAPLFWVSVGLGVGISLPLSFLQHHLVLGARIFQYMAAVGQLATATFLSAGNSDCDWLPSARYWVERGVLLLSRRCEKLLIGCASGYEHCRPMPFFS